MLILLNSRKSLDDCDRFIIRDCLLYNIFYEYMSLVKCQRNGT